MEPGSVIQHHGQLRAGTEELSVVLNAAAAAHTGDDGSGSSGRCCVPDRPPHPFTRSLRFPDTSNSLCDPTLFCYELINHRLAIKE